MSQLLSSISEIPELSSGAHRALVGLMSFRNAKTGQCNPKLPLLCKRLGVAWDLRRKVYRWLAELVAKGVMKRGRRRFAGPIWYEFPGLAIDAKNDTYAGDRNDTYAGDRNDTYGGAHPLYEQTKGEQGQQRAKRAAAFPQSDNLPVAAPDLSAVPRKGVGIERYFDPANGRFLSRAQMQQVGWAAMHEVYERYAAREREKERKQA